MHQAAQKIEMVFYGLNKGRGRSKKSSFCEFRVHRLSSFEAADESMMARIAALSGAESFDQAATTFAKSGLEESKICARICVQSS